MIGNKYLQELFDYKDEDTAMNQLLEYLKNKDKSFIKSLYKDLDLNKCNKKEIDFLTKATALVDYYLQIHNLEIPDWIRDDRLEFNTPYFHSKRIDDIKKIKLLYSSPAPFSARNVYFELEGIHRV